MITYFDRNEDLVKQLRSRGINAVQTHDPIKDLDYDWVVSPANCYGPMDGGFDLYLAIELDIDPRIGWRPYIDQSYELDMREQYLDPGQVVEWYEKNILIATTVVSPVANTTRPVEPDHIASCLDGLYERSHGVDIICPGLGTGYGGLTKEEFADLIIEARES